MSIRCGSLILLALAAVPIPSLGSAESARRFAEAMWDQLAITPSDCHRKLVEADRKDRNNLCGTTELDFEQFSRKWDEALKQLPDMGLQIKIETDWYPYAFMNGVQERDYIIDGTPLSIRYRVSSGHLAVMYSNYSWNQWPCDESRYQSIANLYDGRRDESHPKCTTNVKPIYPELARVARQQGTIMLEVVVGTSGEVMAACVKQPHNRDVGFEAVAMATVKHCKYDTKQIDGSPVPAVWTVPFEFTLTDPPANPR